MMKSRFRWSHWETSGSHHSSLKCDILKAWKGNFSNSLSVSVILILNTRWRQRNPLRSSLFCQTCFRMICYCVSLFGCCSDCCSSSPSVRQVMEDENANVDEMDFKPDTVIKLFLGYKKWETRSISSAHEQKPQMTGWCGIFCYVYFIFLFTAVRSWGWTSTSRWRRSRNRSRRRLTRTSRRIESSSFRWELLPDQFSHNV